MGYLGMILLIGGGITFNVIPVIVVKLKSIPLMIAGYFLVKHSPIKKVNYGK